MSSSPAIFSPLNLGTLHVKNRIWMAPLTRSRALSDGTPTPMMIKHYRDRASAGLIISEATNISPEARGYEWTPGIFKEQHIEAWKKITDAVHEAGGHMFCQLWHVGRVSHQSLLAEGTSPLAPSAVSGTDIRAFTREGRILASTPDAMDESDIQRTINDYAKAAKNARLAGFDGVEIHGANGYLIHQFLSDNVNLRTDDYGGSIENRCRFPLEVVDAVRAEWGLHQVGLRIAPVSPSFEMECAQPQPLYEYFMHALSKRAMAFVHVIVGATMNGSDFRQDEIDYLALKKCFGGLWVVNNGFDFAKAVKAIDTKTADAVTFGRAFIANPDLVARFQNQWPLQSHKQESVYGGGEEGYNDYAPYESANP